MNKKSWSNGEGYSDKTAGAAIQRVSREERKKTMAKRSCRRDLEQKCIHEKAVKIRKMTDEQLINYINDRVEKARSEGFNKGKLHKSSILNIDIERIVKDIGCVKGIGDTKLGKIKIILESHLEGDKSA